MEQIRIKKDSHMRKYDFLIALARTQQGTEL